MNTPTPLRSHSLFVRALTLSLLLVPGLHLPASAAPSGWTKVVCEGDNRVLYYPTNAKPNPRGKNHEGIDLYWKPLIDPDQMRRDPFKVLTHLHKLPSQTEYVCHLLDGGKDASVKFRSEILDSSAEILTPEGIDRDIWDLASQKFSGYTDKYKSLEFNARVLQAIKDDPKGGMAGVQKFLAYTAAKETTKGDNGSAALLYAGNGNGWDAGKTAKEAMGWADDPGGSEPPRRNPGEVPPVPPGTVVGGDPNHPVNRVNEALGKNFDERAPDIAARIVDYTWPKGKEPADGKWFISEKIRQDEALRAGVTAAAVTWVKKPENRAAVLSLYYGLGAGENPPDWVTADENLKKYLADGEYRRGQQKLKAFEKLLTACLDRWAGGDGRPKYCNLKDESGQARMQLGGDKLPEWTQAFLADAGAEAIKILNSTIPADVLRGIIGDRNEPPPVPGSPGTRKPPPTGGIGRTGPSFKTDELFGTWGDANVIFIDGRMLSIVLRTRRSFQGKGPDMKAVVTHQIGVYDISNKSDIYGMRFDITSAGSQSFSLKDGGKNYTLKLTPQGGDTGVSIARSNGKPIEFGNAFQNSEGQGRLMTINEMFAYRAQTALGSPIDGPTAGAEVWRYLGRTPQEAQESMRQPVTTVIGGKTYHVTGESSDRGALLFWDEETLAQVAAGKGDIRAWGPEMMAYTNHKVGGFTQKLANQVNMGKIGGKWYDLKFNKAAGIWEPTDCGKKEGCPQPPDETPKPEEKKDETSTAGGDGKTETGGTGTGTTGGGAWDAKLAVDGNYTDGTPTAKKVNEALSGDLKDKLHFYEDPAKGYDRNNAGVVRFLINFKGKTGGIYLSHLPFPGEDKYKDKVPEINSPWPLNGRVLVTETGAGQVYLSLDKILATEGKDSEIGRFYKLDDVGTPAFGFTDIEVFSTVLTSLKYPTEAVDTVTKNLKTQMGKRNAASYTLSAKRYKAEEAKPEERGLVVAALIAGTTSYTDTIYPEIREGAISISPEAAEAGRKGSWSKEAADNKDALASFDGFSSNLEIEGLPVSKRELVAPADAAGGESGVAALYLKEEGADDNKDKHWFLQTTVTADNLAPEKKRVIVNSVLVFQDLKDDAKAVRINKPAGLGIGGITFNGAMEEKKAINFEIKGLNGDETKEKHAYIGAYMPGQHSPQCVGVVAWWGASQEEACKACGASWAGGVCKNK